MSSFSYLIIGMTLFLSGIAWVVDRGHQRYLEDQKRQRRRS